MGKKIDLLSYTWIKVDLPQRMLISFFDTISKKKILTEKTIETKQSFRQILLQNFCPIGQFCSYQNECKLIFSVGDHEKGKIETPQKDHRVAKIIVHPNWSSRVTNNDIAVLELTDPIQFDSVDYHVFPICLPDEDVPVGTQCYITGISTYTYIYMDISRRQGIHLH